MANLPFEGFVKAVNLRLEAEGKPKLSEREQEILQIVYPEVFIQDVAVFLNHMS